MTGFNPLSLDETTQTNQKFAGKAYILGPKWAHLPIITIGLLGVQIFWSVEMGYASPYLLSLGLSKSAMSLVFLAGPLSGLFMQPIIGVLADTSTSKFGRRRPFMVLGTIVCVFAMLVLGYTRAFASVFTTKDTKANDALTVLLAVVSIYLIDFSINAVMAMDRALVVDTLPPASQASANAWAARMLGVGAVVGFLFGTIPLPKILPVLGTTELEVLSVIVAGLLFAGHMLMAVCVKERVLLKSADADRPLGKKPNPFIREARELWSNLLTLPPVIRQIFIIQFFAWIAWFPILFYTTIYIGDLYRRSTPVLPSITHEERDNEATRLGTRALFYSSVIALVLNVVLPAFVVTTRGRGGGGELEEGEGMWRSVRIPQGLKVNLATLWAVSHLVLAGCMFATWFTESVMGATVLMSVTGFSWAITQWAPFSLLAEAILTTPETTSTTRNSILLADARTPVDEETTVLMDGNDEDRHLGEDRDIDELEIGGEDGHGRGRGPTTHGNGNGNLGSGLGLLGNRRARVSRVYVARDGDEDGDGEVGQGEGETGGLSAKAGIILGIHNVFIVVPQFLVTGFSAVIFAVFDSTSSSEPVSVPVLNPGGNSTGLGHLSANDVVREVAANSNSNSVVYIFRLGGVSALIAFVLCWRLARELRHR